MNPSSSMVRSLSESDWRCRLRVPRSFLAALRSWVNPQAVVKPHRHGAPAGGQTQYPGHPHWWMEMRMVSGAR